ncbi:MAG: hypothetical protein ABSE68_00085 [Minisyncoccia bacterium]
MNAIIGINCSDFECVKKLFGEAAGLSARAVQIDVSDGKFAPVKTWGNPEELREILKEYPGIETEIHLMVEEPEKVFENWLSAGAKRLVIHIESAGNLFSIRDKTEALGMKVIWGLRTETPIESLVQYLKNNQEISVQFLAVSPGFSNQVFDSRNIERIKRLRERWPNIEIRVDGGMNPETAEMAKKAGADAVVSVSYIFEGSDAAAAYKTLLNL